MPPPQQQKAPAPPPPSGPRYVAVYDYTAADDDEISFQEGKLALSLSLSLSRTGAYGMLPSNYIEKP
jgi:hypothetical protein